MAVTDSLPSDAPVISGKASTLRHGHIITFQDVPVLEGSVSLRDLMDAPSYWDDQIFVFQYHLLPDVAVISETERAALAYLADCGFLDGLLVDRETARQDERQYMRLGNASLPFDLQGAYMRLSTATIASLTSMSFPNKYRIMVQGVDMGTYKGMTEEDALEAYAKDAGYDSLYDLESSFKRPRVEEVI
jgi:hypothetical protein